MAIYRRGGIWWVKFQRDGVVVRRSARTTSASQARAAERAMRAEAERISRGPASKTFDEVMLRFLSDHLPTLRPRAAERYMTSLKALRPHFTRRIARDISKGDVADFVSARKASGVSTATIRRDLACGSIAFSLANEWEWADSNPFRAYSKRALPEATPRTRVLSLSERREIIAGSERYAAAFIAALLTGMRAGEICALRWPDIDTQTGEVTVRDSKNRRPRVIPLDDEGLAHFRAQRRIGQSPFVFSWGDGKPFTVAQLSRAFRRAAMAANIKNARLHDTRHTFASDRIARGMDLYTLSRIMGHSTLQMTAKYAHLQTDSLRAAMRRSGAKSGTTSGTVLTDFTLAAEDSGAKNDN